MVLVAIVTVCATLSGVDATKCYVCTSSTVTCLENFFVSIGIPSEAGCTCCTKTVTSDGTSRECASGLSSLFCIPTPNTHVCLTDYCNAANGLRHPGHLVVLTAVAGMLVAFFAR
jgi:hypothetical protein